MHCMSTANQQAKPEVSEFLGVRCDAIALGLFASAIQESTAEAYISRSSVRSSGRCPSVSNVHRCLLAISRRSNWSGLHGNSPEMYLWTRKNWLNCGSDPHLYPVLGIFWSIFLRDWAIFPHNLAHRVSGKTVRIFIKISSYMRLWTRKSALNFGSHSDPNWIRIGFVLAELLRSEMLSLQLRPV